MSELVDGFMEHHPISPVGTTIKPNQLKAVQKEVRSLRTQLAKANERVAELESQHQLLTKQIEPLLDMQEDGEYYTRCDLADDIYEAFIEGSSVDALNKFAIEKKIEALEWMAKNVVPKELSVTTLWKRIEQLRKGQEK